MRKIRLHILLYVKICLLLTILSGMNACNTLRTTTDLSAPKDGKPVDKKATPETVALHERLKQISKNGFAIGHQDATAYGVNWRYKDSLNAYWSDIKDVSGDYPAVYGFDLGHIELGSAYNLDTVPFVQIRELIRKAAAKGGIVTLSWHLNNPATNGSSWDTSKAVQDILKGGPKREKYELWVGRLADFLNSLEDFSGRKIPVVFRPFHEMNGSWFWWGAGSSTTAEYKALWVETLSLLINKHDIHHLIYAYSPNTFNSENEFNRFYPGDRYVDILGVDIYNHNGDEAFMKDVTGNLGILKKLAAEKNKIFALTETGNTKKPTADWWTRVLYPSVKDSGATWLLLWRNARPNHYFAPYPGIISEQDFILFKSFKDTLFLNEINLIKMDRPSQKNTSTKQEQ